jgi:hypothetical protein
VIQSFVIFIPFGAGDRTQFQIPARSQILPLCASPANAQDFETAKQKSSRAFAYWFCSFSNWFSAPATLDGFSAPEQFLGLFA